MEKKLDNLSIIFSVVGFLISFLVFISTWLNLSYIRALPDLVIIYLFIFGIIILIVGLVIGIIALIKKSGSKWKPIISLVLFILLLGFIYYLFISDLLLINLFK